MFPTRMRNTESLHYKSTDFPLKCMVKTFDKLKEEKWLKGEHLVFLHVDVWSGLEPIGTNK